MDHGVTLFLFLLAAVFLYGGAVGLSGKSVFVPKASREGGGFVAQRFGARVVGGLWFAFGLFILFLAGGRLW